MRSETKLAATDVKRLNKNRIFRLIHYAGKISRQEIADILNLSLPTVNQNLKLLKDEKLIRFEGNFASTGGRKPQVIAVNARAKCAVCLNILEDGIRIALLDLFGEIMDYAEPDFVLKDDSVSGAAIAKAVCGFIAANGVDDKDILGIGITVPGIFDNDNKVIVFSPAMGIKQYPIAGITDALPYPYVALNDARSNAIAEFWQSTIGSRTDEWSASIEEYLGAANGYRIEEKLYLMLNNGVGGSYLKNDEIRKGKNNCYGEFGHMTIRPGGRPCFCGKRGCFESYVSARCLSTQVGTTLEGFFNGLAAGNTVYENVFKAYLDDLTTGINNLHVISDSDVVVGGAVSRYLGPYVGQIRKMLSEKYAFDTDGSYFSLAKCTPMQADMGAALIFISEYIRTI